MKRILRGFLPLALLAGLAPLGTAHAATIVVDDGFDGTPTTYLPGQAPTDWTQASRFGTSTVTLEPGGTFKIDMSPSAVTAVYNNSNTFDPTLAGTTVTTKTSVVSYTATGTAANLTSWGTQGPNAANIGWSLDSTGQFSISAAVDGANDIATCNGGAGRCIYTVTPTLKQLDGVTDYAGGSITVTATFSSSGIRLTTDTGYDSATDPNAVGGYIPYSLLEATLDFGDFVSGSHAGLGMVGTSGIAQYDRIQLFTATGADVQTVSSPTTQSTTVATTTLSVTTGGSVNQTSGTTTVLETMTVKAGATYELSGGTLQVSKIVVEPGGTFTLNGGTLAADEIDGDVTNITGGIVSPGSSPGLTDILGDYLQNGSGTLLIELAGLNPASEHDLVRVSGTATLGGILDIDLLYGFTPEDGDTFDILTAVAIAGTFNTLNLPTLSAGMVWNKIEYLVDEFGSTDVVRLSVSAVPIPATVWLFGSALGLVGFLRRRTA